MNLAITSKEISAQDMGRYFSLASTCRDVPSSIAENVSGDPQALRKACIEYVTQQLEELNSEE